MTFFEPTQLVVSWIVELAAGRPIIECGYGDGKLLRMLTQRYRRVLGIDPYPRGCKDLTNTLAVRAEESSALNTPSLLVIARLDHSGWPEQVFKAMSPRSDLLYIGYAKNLLLDLGEAAPYFSNIEIPDPSIEEVAFIGRRKLGTVIEDSRSAKKATGRVAAT